MTAMTHQYWRNPYRPSEVRLAWVKQYNYILILLNEREYAPEVPRDKQEQIIRDCRDGKGTPLTSKAASDMIEALRAAPYRQRAGNPAHEARVVEDGFYEARGRIYKLLTSMAGRRYAKVLNDRGKFEYIEGGSHEVFMHGSKLSLERAKELGKLHGRCIICGAELTADESIKAGIGPVCAKKV